MGNCTFHSTHCIFYVISIKAQIFAFQYDRFNSFKFPLTQTLSHSIVRSIFMQTCMHFCEEEHFTVYHLLSIHHSMLILKCWKACRHMAVLLNTVHVQYHVITYTTCKCKLFNRPSLLAWIYNLQMSITSWGTPSLWPLWPLNKKK